MYEKVVVTGASGGIGGFVADDLRDRCQLTLLDVVPGKGPDQVDIVDVRDIDALRAACQGQDAIVHLACLHETDRTVETLNVNVGSTCNVLSVAEELGLRKAIIMSSEAGLGMEYLDTDPPALYLPIDERHPFRPRCLYGVSKQMCEIVGQNFARRGTLPVVCLRPTEVTFPRMVKDLTSRLVTEPALGAREVTRTWTETAGLAISRAYVRPDDMARMIRLALEAETEPYEVFWASAADTYAPQPTLELMRELYGSLPEIVRPRLYQDDPRAAVFDITAARERLEWEPTGDWQQAVDEIGTGDA